MSTAPQPKTAGVLAPPPILFFACLLLGWGLGLLRPFEPFDLPIGARVGIGLGLFLLAFALGGAALVTMHRARTPAEPWKPTVHLVASGPFRFTRNPIYVALILALLGMAAMTGNGWILLFVPVLYGLLDWGVVRREERYLAGLFGEEYGEYKRRVRRWL